MLQVDNRPISTLVKIYLTFIKTSEIWWNVCSFLNSFLSVCKNVQKLTFTQRLHKARRIDNPKFVKIEV